MTIAACKECAFYVGERDFEDGPCHRYPDVVTVEADYWCGEFRPYGTFAWQPPRPEPVEEADDTGQ